VFDANNLALPCQHCSTDPIKAANCIKEYTQNQQTPPPQSNTDGHRMKEYVDYYERINPNATMDDILAYLNTRPWNTMATATMQQPVLQQTMAQPMVAENAQNGGYIWSTTYNGGYSVGNGTSYYPS
jgi:hypothetical protein